MPAQTTAPQLHTKVFKSVLENVDVEQYLIDTPGQAVFTTGGFGQSTVRWLCAPVLGRGRHRARPFLVDSVVNRILRHGCV